MRFGIRELLYLMLLIGVAAGAYFTVLQPLDTEIAEYDADTAAKVQKLAELAEAQRVHDDLDAEIKKLAEAIAKVEERLPPRSQTEDILRDIWQIASKNKLNPKKVNTNREVPGAQYIELPIELTIVGDFDGYYNFIKQIEELPRITRMSKMKLKKLEREGEGFIEANLVLSIFFQGDAAA